MVGGQFNGKVYLLASKTLTEVELRSEADEIDMGYRRYRYPAPPPTYRHFVTAEMKDWIQVVADSYAEAFSTLFDQWTPGQRAQIESRQQAIEA